MILDAYVLYFITHIHSHITLDSPVSPRQHVVWLGVDKWCSKRRVKVKQGHLQTMNFRSCGIHAETFKNDIGCVCTLFHYTHPHHITLESPVSRRQHVVWLGADKWCSKRRVKVKQGHLQTMNFRSCGIPQNFQKWYWMRMYSISLHTSTPYNIGKPSVSASTCCMTWRWQVVQ